MNVHVCAARACLWEPWSLRTPPHSAAGPLQATPWVWTGNCSEQVRHPAPPFLGDHPQYLPGPTDTHLERAGVWVKLWFVSVDTRLEWPGEAMLGVRRAGETQDSHLPPGTCTRDLLNFCPSLLCLPEKWSRGGGWATWFGEGRRPFPALQPSPIAFPFPPHSELDFGAITLNSMDATSERDFVGESWEPSRRCGFDPWVGKTPWSRKWQSMPGFLPGKSHGQRSLLGCSPWGRKRVRHDLATKQ